ncbi:hypothetical protein H2248_003950 [Termitomyces sp. 'cryptogamus']|nr:hypothetical protein H2248_003950 [Termitomyces sp. 'cryptogamus']
MPPLYLASTAVLSPPSFAAADPFPRPPLPLPVKPESPIMRALSWPACAPSPLTPLADTLPRHALQSSRLAVPPPSPDSALFTTRTFPFLQSLLFLLLYHRFPVSSFYAPSATDSPLTLFNPSHPGGTYNPPCSPLDLYTPHFVRGKGPAKHGLCPICISPAHRIQVVHPTLLPCPRLIPAQSTCHYPPHPLTPPSYHMQYYHGISATTQWPFSPPLAFCTTPRTNPAKYERTSICEAKCHKCTRWVPVEGIKDVQPKVKELFWWKHAATCHGTSPLDTPLDIYEHDAIYAVVSQL